jgi:hypothetical protein
MTGQMNKTAVTILIGLLLMAGIFWPAFYLAVVSGHELSDRPAKTTEEAVVFARATQGAWIISPAGLTAVLATLPVLVVLSIAVWRCNKTLELKYWLMIVIGSWAAMHFLCLQDQYRHRGDGIILDSDSMNVMNRNRFTTIPYAQIERMIDRKTSVRLELKNGRKAWVDIEGLGGGMVFFRTLSEMVSTYKTNQRNVPTEGASPE